MPAMVIRTGSRFHAQVTLAAVAMLGAIDPAWPQKSQPPATAAQPQPPAPAPAAAPAPTEGKENPGLVNEIGKLLKDPSSLLPSFVTSPEAPAAPRPDSPPPEPATAAPAPAPPPAPAAPAAAAPSPPASGSLLPSIVSGKAACPAAANGAPDCEAAADALCKSKGHGGGRSLTIDASEKCSAKVLIPGRKRQPGDCRTESFVTRAFCQ